MTTMNSKKDLAKHIKNLLTDTDFDFSKKKMVETIVAIFEEWKDSEVPAYGEDWSEFLEEFDWDVLIQEAEERLAEEEQVDGSKMVIKCILPEDLSRYQFVSKNDLKRYVDGVVNLNVDFDVDVIAQELFVIVWKQHLDNLRGSLTNTPVFGEDWSKYLKSFDWNELILKAEENLFGC